MQLPKINFRVFWGILMVIVYACMAYLLIFTSLFEHAVPGVLRIVFGVVFLIYGVYRGYRIYKA